MMSKIMRPLKNAVSLRGPRPVGGRSNLKRGLLRFARNDRENLFSTLIIPLLSAIAVAALLLGSSVTATAQNGVTVSVNAPAKVEPDTNFTASVNITDVTDFDAGQFDISYDESVLRLDDVTAGRIDSTEIPVALWNEMSPGTYRIIVNVPGVPGVSGSGYLATLDFHVVGSAGSSTINLSNGFLNNNLGEEIAATWTGGSIAVHGVVANQASAVPKLPIAALLGAVFVGSVGYFWLRRRKRLIRHS